MPARSATRTTDRLVAVAFVAALAAAGCGEPGSSVAARSPTPGQPEPPPAPMYVYPDSWRATAAQARSRAQFRFMPPTHRYANLDNVKEVYVQPDGGRVILVFPPPPHATPGIVRRDTIEVAQGTPPPFDLEQEWERLASENPGGVEVVSHRGTKFLKVYPANPYDAEQRNVAYIEFIWRGVDVVISGGADLDLLFEIADTILDQ